MLMIRVYVNRDHIDEVGVVNTGHTNKQLPGMYLYRISYPEEYKERFNHVEIWHDRDKPWSVLIEKTLNVINEDTAWVKKRLEEDHIEFLSYQFLDLIKEDK